MAIDNVGPDQKWHVPFCHGPCQAKTRKNANPDKPCQPTTFEDMRYDPLHNGLYFPKIFLPANSYVISWSKAQIGFFFFWCQVKMNCAKMPQPKSGCTPIQPVCRLYLNHFQHLDEKGTAGQPLMFSTVHPFWNPRGTNLMLKKNCAQSLL